MATGEQSEQSEHELSAKTFGNEDALPRVPLPSLEQSCGRFLEWCAPLLDEEQLAATRAAVDDALRPDSPLRSLQAALEAYDAEPGVASWLDTFWPNRYLGRRDRIALNANFYFLFDDTGQDQVDRAATLVAAATAYKLAIDAETVAPPVQRGRAQTIDQLHWLFSCTRIPGREIDTVRTPYSEAWPGPSEARHVVAFHRGHAYRMDVVAPDGRPYTVAELAGGVRALLAADDEPAAPGTSAGHLTTKARAEWAADREALLALDPANGEALEAIETALFCLALEDEQPADVQAIGDRLLSGDGGNRWFDKAVTIVVFPGGEAGLNCEHCLLDGTTIVALVEALVTWTPPAGSEVEGEGPAGSIAPVPFVLDDALRAAVVAADEDFAAYGDACATRLVEIDDFTAETPKRLKCSPDAFVQLAYQLAHHRARGRIGATYESVATRGFRHGRTEAMRVVTPEVVAFVASTASAAVPDDDKRSAFRAAAEAHVARAKQCQAGDAPEQHLWELQLLQRRRGAELGVTGPLALYDSPGWTVMRDDWLSTSSVPSELVRWFGFGSTSPTCIGVGYILVPDRFHLCLSAPRTHADTMAAFEAEFRRALTELEALLADG